MTSKIKNNYAYVITQDIRNKFIEHLSNINEIKNKNQWINILDLVKKSDPEDCQLFCNKSIMYVCGFVMDKRVKGSKEERLNLGGRDLNVWRTT